MTAPAAAVDATESRLRAALHCTQVIYIQPDLLRRH